MVATLVGALIGVAVGPDPAGRARRAARPAGVRVGDRGDARPRRRHRLRAADHRPLPRAGRRGRQPRATRRRKAAATSGASVVAAGLDRDARDRRPARDRHPVHRQARPRRRDRRRRRRRLGDHDPADHDRRASAAGWSRRSPSTSLPSPAFARWGEIVTARPWVSIAAGVLVLLIFASPVTQLRLGQPDDGNQPEVQAAARRLRPAQRARSARAPTARSCSRSTSRRAAPDNQAQLDKLQKAVAATPGMAAGRARRASARTARWRRSSRSRRPRRRTQATSDLLADLRENVIPAAVAGTPLKVYVGGNTAGFEDFSAKVASRLPVFIAVVIGLSVLLLIMAFRSLWVPLVSAVFNLLSVGAAYGVVVAVFQQGVGASLLGVDSGVPIVSFIPVMMFAILFGLEHGLQRLPALADPRGLQRGRRPARERDPRPVADRQGDPLRRPDHGLGVPGLRHPARRDREDVRPRPRPRDPDRRPDRPPGRSRPRW